jgi:hypothetical protein
LRKNKKAIVETSSCATTTSDHKSEKMTSDATMKYVMLIEEHFCNVGILKRVHHSNVVSLFVFYLMTQLTVQAI